MNGTKLWVLANVLVAVFTVALAYYNGIVVAILIWIAFTLVLLVFRPQ